MILSPKDTEKSEHGRKELGLHAHIINPNVTSPSPSPERILVLSVPQTYELFPVLTFYICSPLYSEYSSYGSIFLLIHHLHSHLHQHLDLP